MRRRKFITLLGGAGIGWPLAGWAQQPDGARHVGILMSVAKSSATEARIITFEQELKKLGWNTANDLQIMVRWGVGDADRIQKYASELVELPSNIIVANGIAPVQALQRLTKTIPIVFVAIVDPVGQGVVQSLARPGGNVTGFAEFEYSIGGKWLQLLRQISPKLARVAVLRDPTRAGQYAVIQAMAQSFGMEVIPIDVNEPSDINRGIAEFAKSPNGGLIVTTGQYATINSKLIVDLADRYRLPTIYPSRLFAARGGLIAYGPDLLDEYRHAANYVSRILKGEAPADLPVQQPTKYELIINLKTSMALGLRVPPMLLATADEVIE